MRERDLIILSIETALGNGSLSLLKGKSEIASFRGEKKISRSEELLLLISTLLSNNGVKLKDVDLVVVSEGPGSFTGIRIGISTAQALAFGLGKQLFGVSVLEALAFSTDEPEVVAVIPTGRNLLVWQEFKDIRNSSNIESYPQISTLQEFSVQIRKAKDNNLKILVESNLCKNLKDIHPYSESIFKCASDNVSVIIALYACFLSNKLAIEKPVIPRYLLETEVGKK